MKRLLLFIFLIIYPVSKELIYNNTELLRSNAVIQYDINRNYNSQKSNKPKKVIGYDDNGDIINTNGQGNPSDPSRGMWELGYEYYYENGYWYRKHTDRWGRVIWEKWSTLFDWDIVGWDWYSGRTHGGNAIYYNLDSPTPIGDFPICLFLLIGIYYIYRKEKKYVWNK